MNNELKKKEKIIKEDNIDIIKNNNKKKVLFLALTLIMFVGVSLASVYYIYQVRDTSENSITTAMLTLQFTSNSSTINLTDMDPQIDAEGIENDPYEFTITNTSSVPINAVVKLELDEGNTIDISAIRYAFFVNDELVVKDNVNASTLELYTFQGLGIGDSVDCKVVFWVDSLYQESNKVFKARIVVDATNTGILYEPILVTFNPNGGGVDPETKDVGVGNSYGTLPTPTKTGYTFVGWTTNVFDANGGTNGSIDASGSFVESDKEFLSGFIPVTKGKSYTITSSTSLNTIGIAYYNANKSFIKIEENSNKSSVTITPSSDGYIRFWVNKDNSTSLTSLIVNNLGVSLIDKITSTSIVVPTVNHILTANWKANIYEVTFDKQNGTGGSDKVNATYNAAMPRALAPTRSGYTFQGYYSSANGGGTKYYNSDMTSNTTYTLTSETTLYAYWGATGYTIGYTLNGGTLAVDNPTSYTIESANITLNNPERVGYTFAGWTGSNGNTPEKTVTIVTGSTGNKNYVANWTPITYTIGYTLNGGTVSSENPVNYTIETSTFTLSNPTKTGYTFTGWSGTDITGTSTSVSIPVGSTGNRSYTANFSAITSTVTFDKQNGSGGTSSVTATYDAAMPEASAPTRTGYTFGGYYSEQNGGGTQYYDASMNSVTNWNKVVATTLYAKWTANTYTIGYTLNGGNNPSTKPTSGTYDSDVQISNPTKTFTVNINANSQGATIGSNSASSTQTFSGWTSTTIGSNAKTGSSSSSYASWDGGTTTNTYFKNLRESGTVTMVANWTAVNVALPSISKTGYTCGYATTSGGDITYEPSGSYTPNTTDNSATIYAKCNSNIYTITLNQQSGSGGTTTIYEKYNTGYYLDDSASTQMSTSANGISIPSRTGYTFGGYYTETNGGGTQYINASGKLTSNASTTNFSDSGTLYAKWIVKTYTVTLDKQSGTGGTSSVTATWGEAMPTAASPVAPSRTGYTFGGYYTGTAGSGTQYYKSDMTSNHIWDIDEDKTLYAYWTSNNYTIEYTLNGGNNPTTKPVSGTYDSDVIISNPTKTVTLIGNANSTGADVGSNTSSAQTFAGWSSSTIGSNAKTGTSATPSNSWNGTATTNTYFRNLRESGTVTMIANWTPVNITLPSLSKTGYSCKWYSASSGGTELGSGGDPYTPAAGSAASVTVFARCTANTYTIGYTLNGGNNPSTKPTSGTYDSDVQISNPTKTFTVNIDANSQGATIGSNSASSNQTFSGWTSTTVGSNAKSGSSSSSYAVWNGSSTKNTYFKNLVESGTVTMVANWTAVDVTLPSISKTGYTCGYATTSGGDITYETSGSYTPSTTENSVTIYAKCNIDTYTITLDEQSGSGGTTTIYEKYATGYYLDFSATTQMTTSSNGITVPSRTGYTFGGYYTGTAGSGTQYIDASGKLTTNASNTNFNDDGTLYAYWTATSYTIGYTMNGGTASPENPTSYNIETNTFTLNNPTKTGYTFDGWSGTGISGTSTSVSITKGSTGNRSYTANFTPISVTVTLDKQSGTGGTSSVTGTYDSAMPSATAPSRTGYTFGGYYASTGGSGTQYYTSAMASAHVWDKVVATTIYAKWTVKTYTITFNKGDGTGGSSSATATWGAAMPSATAPSLTGYIFKGYYTGENGTGTQYYDESMQSVTNWNIDNNTTLYAKWDKLMAANLSYDNTRTGVDCSDAQCMIDELAGLLD